MQTHRELLKSLIAGVALACAVQAQAATPGAVALAKSDGSKQCEEGRIDLATMQAELTGSGITVVSSSCANDGLIRPAVCGAATGALNVFEVPRADVPAARALGFTRLAAFPDAVAVECPANEGVLTSGNAVEININGIGPGVDQLAFERVRRVVGNAVATGTVDNFLVYGYGREGGFSACAEAGKLAVEGAFDTFVGRLRAIRPDPATTAYSVSYVKSCPVPSAQVPQ